MSPQEQEALARQMLESAALAEGGSEPMAQPDAPEHDELQAAAIFAKAIAAERAARRGAAVALAASSPASDAAWFEANPHRELRVRPDVSDASCFAVVRLMRSYGRPDVTLVALEAVGGGMPDNTDEAGFAALQADRRWRRGLRG